MLNPCLPMTVPPPGWRLFQGHCQAVSSGLVIRRPVRRSGKIWGCVFAWSVMVGQEFLPPVMVSTNQVCGQDRANTACQMLSFSCGG